MMFRTIACLLMMTASAVGFASPQSLDLSFAGTGWTTVPPGIQGTNDLGFKSAIQTDGKIIVAGLGTNVDNPYGPTPMAVVRVNLDGTPDSTFGQGGKAYIQTAQYSYGRSVALQSDGKIVIAGGFSDGTHSGAFVCRLNTNGSIDTTFATTFPNNVYTLVDNTQGAIVEFLAVAIDPSGRIVGAGRSYNDRVTAPSDDFMVVRLLANGQPDPAFGSDIRHRGRVLIPFDLSGAGNDVAWDLAIQPDGRILVAGEAQYSGGDSDFAVARLDTSGHLDPTFGNGGKTTVWFDRGGDDYDSAQAMALQPDGSIVLSGIVTAMPGYYHEVGMTRLTPSGILDTGFGLSGKIDWIFEQTGGTVDHPVDNFVSAMLLGSDGNLWVFGIQEPDTAHPDGATGYLHVGSNGRTYIASGAFAVGYARPFAVKGAVRDAIGRIVLSGWDDTTNATSSIALVRLQGP